MSELLAMDGLLATVGLCLGSYVGTAVLRSSAGRQSARGRSNCDHCGLQLSFVQTVPVLSYVRQGGACSACGGRISGVHLIAELSGAAILVAAFAVAPPLEAALLALLGLLLLAEAIWDARTGRLPDVLTFSVALAGAGLALFRSMDALMIGVFCAAVTYLSLQGLRRAYWMARGRHGLGYGDVKLLTALSIWTGLDTPWIIVGAAVAGLAIVAMRRPASNRLAFGPCIAIAAWLVGIFVKAGPAWT